MIDPLAEAKRFITYDEVVQALIDDDPDTRFGVAESDGPRTESEGRDLALGTMMHCWFQELRPVVFRHSMVDWTYVARDTSDGLVTAAINVMLNGSHMGYPLEEIFDLLRHRTILWRRVDVALLLARHGVPVPNAVTPVPKRTRTPPPSEEPQTLRKRRTPTVQEVIAPYVAKVMRAHPDYTADDLYNHMRRDAGNDGSPFSRVTTGGKLFCVENSKNCSPASAIAAMTAYNKTR